MINFSHSVALIAVMAIVTALLRFLPFLLFSKKTPKLVLYLGKVLPAAAMAMLVVYTLKGIRFTGHTHAIPEVTAIAVVTALHKWKHNTLLSILAGTITYMVLIQVVFG